MIISNINPTEPTPLKEVLRSLDLMSGSVVIEGLDCVGKTTASNILLANPTRLYLTPTRRDHMPAELKVHYDYITIGQYRAFFDVARQRSVVMDRCHLSSFVFGSTEWSEVAFCEADLCPDIRGIYLYADEEVVKERMRKKGEPQELFDLYLNHQLRYEQALRLSAIPFIKINTSLTTV